LIKGLHVSIAWIEGGAMDEKELYAHKDALLKRAVANADKLDAEDEKKVEIKPVSEHEPENEQ
jgi:hypothetical protein